MADNVASIHNHIGLDWHEFTRRVECSNHMMYCWRLCWKEGNVHGEEVCCDCYNLLYNISSLDGHSQLVNSHMSS